MRLNDRYLQEVVETYNLCPFARHARLTGELVRRVLLQHDPAPEPTLEAIDALEAGSASVIVCILIYPRLSVPPAAFDHFVQRVRAADQRRRGARRPTFVAASFHPDYGCDLRSPERLVPFLRRSPDPSIQLVRHAVLEELRGRDRGTFHFDYSPAAWAELERRLGTRSVTERIAADNHALVERESPARLDEIYDDILADRARTYARFPSP